jgi:hypothetical protein
MEVAVTGAFGGGKPSAVGGGVKGAESAPVYFA